MFNPGKRHKPGRSALGARVRLLGSLLLPWAAAATGCGFWDDFRAEDYSIKAYLHPEDPLVVLRTTTDGNKRARALARVTEPLQNKGNQEDQEYAIKELTKAATQDRQMYARLAAIHSLSTFRDPRACDALVDAYYKSDMFAADMRSVIRIQAINGLGKIGNPQKSVLDLLVNVVQAPPIETRESSEAVKQMYLDERLAAAAALEHFKDPRATEALVQVLKSERDVALRDRAHHSLQTATGKKLPPDAQAWEELLNNPAGGRDRPVAQDKKGILGSPIQRTSATDRPQK